LPTPGRCVEINDDFGVSVCVGQGAEVGLVLEEAEGRDDGADEWDDEAEERNDGADDARDGRDDDEEGDGRQEDEGALGELGEEGDAEDAEGATGLGRDLNDAGIRITF